MYNSIHSFFSSPILLPKEQRVYSPSEIESLIFKDELLPVHVLIKPAIYSCLSFQIVLPVQHPRIYRSNMHFTVTSVTYFVGFGVNFISKHKSIRVKPVLRLSRVDSCASQLKCKPFFYKWVILIV